MFVDVLGRDVMVPGVMRLAADPAGFSVEIFDPKNQVCV